MVTRLITGVLALVLLCCGPVHACRLFGSNQFVEDKTGGIWFTEGDNNAISRLAPDGRVTSYQIPTANAEPSSIALDPKGNLWFAESEGKKIGRLGRDGRIVEYPVGDGMPYFIAVDRQGEAWFTQTAADHDHGGGEHTGHAVTTPARVGRIDRVGHLHTYPLDEGDATSIAVDSGNRIWVTIAIYGQGENGVSRGKLARLGRDGFWEILSTWDESPSCPARLKTMPAGGVVFADGCRNVLTKISPSGAIKETRLPPDIKIQDMAFAPDGLLWFSDREHIGYFDKNDKPIHISRPANDDSVFAIFATRRGDIVYSEGYNYNINRLKKTGEFVEHLISVDERRSQREIKDGDYCRVEFASRIAAKAEMDSKRAEEVRIGRFKPDGKGTEKLAEQKCLVCHDARRLLLSRRSDWAPSINRMHANRTKQDLEPLTAEDTKALIGYFNENYGWTR